MPNLYEVEHRREIWGGKTSIELSIRRRRATRDGNGVAHYGEQSDEEDDEGGLALGQGRRRAKEASPPAAVEEQQEGPFQCEICRNIMERKEDFVRHIKVRHGDVVDASVIERIERDLKVKTKVTKARDSMKECKEIMRELFAKKHQEFAWPFYRPVDTRVFTDYRSIVKRPMDMGTVRNKLAAGEYDDPGRSFFGQMLSFEFYKLLFSFANPTEV